jgi:hypothetical protein
MSSTNWRKLAETNDVPMNDLRVVFIYHRGRSKVWIHMHDYADGVHSLVNYRNLFPEGVLFGFMHINNLEHSSKEGEVVDATTFGFEDGKGILISLGD